MKPLTESNIESFALKRLQSIGWQHVHGLAIAPGAEQAQRESFDQIILTERLRKAVAVLNPDILKKNLRTDTNLQGHHTRPLYVQCHLRYFRRARVPGRQPVCRLQQVHGLENSRWH